MRVSCPSICLHLTGQWPQAASGDERPVINSETEVAPAVLPLAGPAELAAGRSVVLKPAEEKPRSAMLRVRCLLDAGLVGTNHFGVSQPELPYRGHKESGPGQEQGAEGPNRYTKVKTVTVGRPF